MHEPPIRYRKQTWNKATLPLRHFDQASGLRLQRSAAVGFCQFPPPLLPARIISKFIPQYANCESATLPGVDEQCPLAIAPGYAG